MSRVQLALNVDDLDTAIPFYTKLFATEPHKIEPGYANFAIDDPPLKLVLFENAEEAGSLNHLGVEVATTAEVRQADARLLDVGVDTTTQESTTCCFAVQDKTWVTDPAGRAWEIYTILDDSPVDGSDPVPVAMSNNVCCGGDQP
jgi:hypothetical protein